jgi:hypothetical protein
MGCPSDLFPSGRPINTLCTFLISPVRVTRPAYLIFLDLISQIIGTGCLMQNTDYEVPHFIILSSRLLPFSVASWPAAMKYTALGLQQYRCVYTSNLLCGKNPITEYHLCVHNRPFQSRHTIVRLVCYICIFHVSVFFALIENKF